MFTGIVEEVGHVRETLAGQLTVDSSMVLDGLQMGDSIAINGTCLTIVSLESTSLQVEVTPETLRLTNLGVLKPGDPVNLERAVSLGGRMSGHMVQGHIEATGRVLSLTPDGTATMLSLEAPPDIMRYVVTKGFIAIDGISLTVVKCSDSSFTVSVIPYTRDKTALGTRKPGDMVNLETDIVARYIERFVKGDSAFPQENNNASSNN